MANLVRPLAAALALICLAPLPPLLAPNAALAQSQPPAGAPDEQVKQIALTDAQIQSYLAAAMEIEPILDKAPQSDSDQLDPKMLAQLETAAKKHQFASFADYQEVAANIGLVLDGIDPQTKKYVGADVVLKKQIAQVQADAKMPAADKKQALAELNDALKSIDPVKNAGNIDLVVKNYDKLAAAEPQQK
jgi:phage gp36-like protein